MFGMVLSWKCEPHLARCVHVVRHTMPRQRLHGAIIWIIANMICTSAAAVELLDQALVRRLRSDGLEDALCHGRTADVA